MNEIPVELKYQKTHEWVRNDGEGVFTIGITDYAQSELGDLVFVELAEANAEVTEGDTVCVVESVKSASDIYAPFAGEIIEVNEELTNTPELINSDPYDSGWLYKIQAVDSGAFDELLPADDYESYIQE